MRKRAACLLVSSRSVRVASALALFAVTLTAPAVTPMESRLPAWMAGSWSANLGGAEVEEHWTAPQAGLMVGMARTVGKNGKASFEHLRIEEKGAEVTYLASPGGRPATPFRRVSGSAREIVFENLEHDFPQRLRYWRKDDATLCARVEKLTGEGDQWCWQRSSLAP